LDGERLYLHRYWTYESSIAATLQAMAEPVADVDDERLKAALGEPRPPDGQGLDRQLLAVAIGASRRLTIRSGGPGTGKTTTVTRLIELVGRMQPELETALAAPTGKAAGRLKEALERHWARRDVAPHGAEP